VENHRNLRKARRKCSPTFVKKLEKRCPVANIDYLVCALSVNNFSSDVKDGENYTILLNQLAPDLCSKAPLRENDLFSRAEQILQNAEKLNCRKYLSPQSLVAGNPKLNLAFVANLFNTHPGLDPLEEVERPELPDVEGDREARGKIRVMFELWYLIEKRCFLMVCFEI